MRTKRNSFYLSFSLSVVALCFYVVPFPALFPGANDVSLALFGSTALVCMISLVEYWSADETLLSGSTMRVLR